MASSAHRQKANDDLVDAIPMNKTKPTTILLALAGGLVVVGALAFTLTRGGGKKVNPNAEAAAAPTTTMTPEEQKRHLEITRKSLEAFEKAEAERQQHKESASSTAAPAEEEHHAAKAAPRPAGAVAAAPARAAAPAPAPEPPKPAKKPNKKAMGDLDGLGSDIAGQLGK